MNTNSAGLITEQPSCSSLYWAVILFLILLSLSKEVKFKLNLKGKIEMIELLFSSEQAF